MIYRSDDINELMADFSKAQGEYKPLLATQDSPSGKYANLQNILTATREALSKYNLAFYQYIELQDEGNGGKLLKTTLAHKSGQWICSVDRIIAGKNLRQTGNLYEITKRLHALSILGIAPSENDPAAFDDNSAEIAEQQLIDEIRKPKKTEREIDKNDTINKDQYQELLIELDGFEAIAKDILECYSIETLADLPREEYHKARHKILKIKKIQEDYESRQKK